MSWAGHTYGREILTALNNYFESHGFSWNPCVDICTHSALASDTTAPSTSQAEEVGTVLFTTTCSNNTASFTQKCV